MIQQKIANIIKQNEKIAIMSHIAPDGDNIGSSLALYNTLKKMGKKVEFILDDKFPQIYRFLKGWDTVAEPHSLEDVGLVISLDCADLERLGNNKHYLGGKLIINIDHHISNTNFGDINLIVPEAAATGEIIYNLIEELGVELDKEIAECLYTAITTDTGHFQYTNTTYKTHLIVADLIKAGVDESELYKKIYQSSTKEKVLLIAKALNSLEFYYNDKVSAITLTKAQIISAGAKDEDTDGLINFARDINTVEVAMLLKEIDKNKTRISLRSKNFVNVCAIAELFGGGGHVRAAGCTIDSDIAASKSKIIEALRKIFVDGEV